ncbi:hemicentin-1-like [Tigriopus californicus]|uniref:hemicentin-1-like n=1 Tax=Tigriopus californicus TaxID=6832 RepID=UPI0027DA6838|nr:hemicentin-1-like [Tigriopus californicus]
MGGRPFQIVLDAFKPSYQITRMPLIVMVVALHCGIGAIALWISEPLHQFCPDVVFLAMKEIKCRQNNGFFNFCGRKFCTDPRDGNWGSWSSEVCNAQICGSGQVVRTRNCDNPVQQIVGLPCSGSDSDTETETIKACDIDCKGESK